MEVSLKGVFFAGSFEIYDQQRRVESSISAAFQVLRAIPDR
jgi:hypothetical protein